MVMRGMCVGSLLEVSSASAVRPRLKYKRRVICNICKYVYLLTCLVEKVEQLCPSMCEDLFGVIQP